MKKKSSHKVQYGTISLPLPLISKIKEKIKGTGINSVSSYVTFILRELFSESDLDEKKAFSEEKIGMVKRLKNLGYI